MLLASFLFYLIHFTPESTGVPMWNINLEISALTEYWTPISQLTAQHVNHLAMTRLLRWRTSRTWCNLRISVVETYEQEWLLEVRPNGVEHWALRRMYLPMNCNRTKETMSSSIHSETKHFNASHQWSFVPGPQTVSAVKLDAYERLCLRLEDVGCWWQRKHYLSAVRINIMVRLTVV